ncbi:unnamed protein product [Fusarium fujikuroi]|uniref:Uncharacterized protein n=1 Tax=Fusarium fujikuroi TaxID=5127 RepID=A0A9Q9RH21_FUSFU|nr:unnamed protein product [Fusarium fujikuroi]VZH91036.1 unnamed protein product [Fusarium fujikuroi]
MINTSRSATTTAANTTAVGILETAALAQIQTILNASANVIVNVLDRTVHASAILARTDIPHLSVVRTIAKHMTATMVARGVLSAKRIRVSSQAV